MWEGRDSKEAFLEEITHKLRAEEPTAQGVGREDGVGGEWGREYRQKACGKVRERSQHSGSWESEQLRMAGVWLLKVDEAGGLSSKLWWVLQTLPWSSERIL